MQSETLPEDNVSNKGKKDNVSLYVEIAVYVVKVISSSFAGMHVYRGGNQWKGSETGHLWLKKKKKGSSWPNKHFSEVETEC